MVFGNYIYIHVFVVYIYMTYLGGGFKYSLFSPLKLEK